MSISDAIGIFSAVGSVIAILIAILKRPHETKNIDADTIKKYAEAADLAADRAQEALKDFDDYRKRSELRISELESEISELKKYKEENEELRNWAERLVHQVQSLGGVPVPMKLPKRK